jgi:hypothetical protein
MMAMLALARHRLISLNRFKTIFENHEEWDPEKSLGSKSEFGNKIIPNTFNIVYKKGDMTPDLIGEGLYRFVKALRGFGDDPELRNYPLIFVHHGVRMERNAAWVVVNITKNEFIDIFNEHSDWENNLDYYDDEFLVSLYKEDTQYLLKFKSNIKTYKISDALSKRYRQDQSR